MKLEQLVKYCDELLSAAEIADYCPNGLQIDAGNDDVTVVCSAVTASFDAIEMAVRHGADVLLVHHGYFWKSEPPQLTGLKGRRIRKLFDSGISLLAYHLPLDIHQDYGNNRQLAQRLGVEDARPWDGDPQGLLWTGVLSQQTDAAELAARLERELGRSPLLLGDPGRPLSRLAWCTGAAQQYIEKAVDAGADAFISGEVSEQTTHLAREYGIACFGAGHHATERYGVQALGQHLADRFNLEHHYLEIDNPV